MKSKNVPWRHRWIVARLRKEGDSFFATFLTVPCQSKEDAIEFSLFRNAKAFEITPRLVQKVRISSEVRVAWRGGSLLMTPEEVS